MSNDTLKVPPNLVFSIEKIIDSGGFKCGELSVFAAFPQREFKSDIIRYFQIREWAKEFEDAE